ncbi:hypothetical protein BCR32DRAFT_288896 [Anaeromyces robustus]|uniref:SEC7 domain-containing protein n=1 Tax=Anaeromyces robustus TaxID=1754192 RepID=A0A1Y1XQD2_9FUNG|nr:hypothetical protein BCR32DRAFT_288896 [Anaeromyces robustus]|eukprot:ORX87952.1 hypothetical protein BCR32DRAFT_288896 [Anaeromyces robustus]
MNNNKKTSDKEDIKQKKTNKSFFSKLWKVGSPQPKDDKKKISKSVDDLNSDDNEIKNLSENPNNENKSKSLDILNANVEIEDINILDNKIESPAQMSTTNNSEEKINEIVPNQNSIAETNKNTTNEDNNKKESNEKIIPNISGEEKENILEEKNLPPLPDNNLEKEEKKEEKNEKKEKEKEKENNNNKETSNNKSNLTVLITNSYLKNDNNLTSKEFADKLYNMEESEYEGKPIALILTENDPFHEETLKYFIENFDFTNIEIDEALRTLCKKVVITGETQQIDRILTQFSRHYFESNPKRRDLFLNEDVTHSIVYSLVLLNTDLHIVYNDNPNKKMTKKEFLKNTMTLLESMNESSTTMQVKSANIPNNNRRSYFEPSSASTHVPFTSATLPRNFTETLENKQKRWKKQMEQLLGELYNSIKSKRILQKTAAQENENNQELVTPNTSNSVKSVDSGPNKIQSLFGNEKSSSSAFSSVKSLITKGTSRKNKDKNFYLSMPTLNNSDSASYNSVNDLSYTNKSFDRLATSSKSYNGLNIVKGNAKIMMKGALNRKHYSEQGKQRAKDRRWLKSHCALFVDQTKSSNGICELRIWLESNKRGAARDMDELFDIAANEEDIESQNLPYYTSNYNEALPITHSITSAIKNYTSFNCTTKKNVFSLKLSSGNTYLFEAVDDITLKDWVNVLNFWAARKSKEPLRGAVGNMEYGWNQVEKIEKPKIVTEEEIHEAIPIYDAFDNNFDVESIKSYTSSNLEKDKSRPASIKSGFSGNLINNKNDSVSSKDKDKDSIVEERTARSFTIKRFRSSSRSTSRSNELRSTTRSISLNRRDSGSSSLKVTTPSVRSYSCTRHDNPSHRSDHDHEHEHDHEPEQIINSASPSLTSSPRDIELRYESTPTTATTTSDGKSLILLSNDNQISPLTQEPMVIEEDDDNTMNTNTNISNTNINNNNNNNNNNINNNTNTSIITNTNSNTNTTIDGIATTPPLPPPKPKNKSIRSQIEDNNSNSNSNSNSKKKSINNYDLFKDSSIPPPPISNINIINGDNNTLLHRRILSEPQLKIKRDIDKNGTKKRSQSLNHYTDSINIIKTLNENNNTISSSIPATPATLATHATPATPAIPSPLQQQQQQEQQNQQPQQQQHQEQQQQQQGEELNKPKIEETNSENNNQQPTSTVLSSTLPFNRIHKANRLASKHQSLIPDKIFNPQRFSIQPTSSSQSNSSVSSPSKKKIKKLRICEWTRPGVGFLLSTLSLEKQYESMKKQYIITEKELEDHRELKQPMEDLYVFQSTPYQKACNNWKRKYLYLLDEKNKYGLYVTILENYMKIDPYELNLLTTTKEKERKSSSLLNQTGMIEPINSMTNSNTNSFSNINSISNSSSNFTSNTNSNTNSKKNSMDTIKEASSSNDMIKNDNDNKNNNENNNEKVIENENGNGNGNVTPLSEKNESPKATEDEIKSILAKKRQQQLDLMKKTANDLFIDSKKIENSKFVLPEIKVNNNLFEDDDYEKELEELAMEQERILNINQRELK